METTSTPQAKVAYSLDEAADVLGVSRASINRFIRRGELRVSRLGWRTVRIGHQALLDLLASKEETGPRSRPERRR